MANDPTTAILVLLRHGDAGEPLSTPELDTLRALTPRGRKQARRAGKALRRLGLAPSEAFTSRLRRANETLTVALEACGGAPLLHRTAALAPDADPARVAKALAAKPSAPHVPTAPPPEASANTPVPGGMAEGVPPGPAAARTTGAPAAPEAVPVRWLVGHDPHLTRLLAHLLGTAPEALRLSKGAFAVVSLDARGAAAGAGTLVCLVPADGLKALARKKQKGKARKRR